MHTGQEWGCAGCTALGQTTAAAVGRRYAGRNKGQHTVVQAKLHIPRRTYHGLQQRHHRQEQQIFA